MASIDWAYLFNGFHGRIGRQTFWIGMIVLTAIVQRQDATLTALLTETRATHSQIARLANRVRKLEES